mmetsp:Transcript_98354/g.298485  ORF Transcript_98354/g.298485 Transcript_98354/m.298485 type:complete len:396 (-) Transcript_98354:7-1194(-)
MFQHSANTNRPERFLPQGGAPPMRPCAAPHLVAGGEPGALPLRPRGVPGVRGQVAGPLWASDGCRFQAPPTSASAGRRAAPDDRGRHARALAGEGLPPLPDEQPGAAGRADEAQAKQSVGEALRRAEGLLPEPLQVLGLLLVEGEPEAGGVDAVGADGVRLEHRPFVLASHIAEVGLEVREGRDYFAEVAAETFHLEPASEDHGLRRLVAPKQEVHINAQLKHRIQVDGELALGQDRRQAREQAHGQVDLPVDRDGRRPLCRQDLLRRRREGGHQVHVCTDVHVASLRLLHRERELVRVAAHQPRGEPEGDATEDVPAQPSDADVGEGAADRRVDRREPLVLQRGPDARQQEGQGQRERGRAAEAQVARAELLHGRAPAAGRETGGCAGGSGAQA